MVQTSEIRQAFTTRLKQACSDAGLEGYGVAARIARAVGVTPKAVSKWFNEESIPALAKMHSLAAFLRVSPEWLMWGNSPASSADSSGQALRTRHPELISISPWDEDTPLDDDEVEVPFLREVQLSAGSGRTAIEQSSQGKLRFGKMTLRKHSVQFDQAICVPVHGNSMDPVLPDGSTVAVNTGATQVNDGKIYALEHDGQLRVKVLYRLPGGGIRLRSYNQAEHPDEEYSAEQMRLSGIVIIGRVFWSAAFH
ncbi:helix-turn-helix domain-containing protein [Pseudomonas sp. 5P_3.1_Bac2]|nr:helix-turn-helix domain-containing protein [Pseudomonas sp. 5P_3.1_Bac2]